MHPSPNRRGWEKPRPLVEKKKESVKPIDAPPNPFRIPLPNFAPWIIQTGFKWADYADKEVVLLPGSTEETKEEQEELLVKEEKVETVNTEKPIPKVIKSKRSFKPRKTKRVIVLEAATSGVHVEATNKVETQLLLPTPVTMEPKVEPVALVAKETKPKGNGFTLPDGPKMNRKTKRKQLKRLKPVPFETPMIPVKESLFFQKSVSLFRFTYPFEHLSTIEIRQCANLSKLGYLKLTTILGILKEKDLLLEFTMAYKLFDYVSSVSSTELYALMISCIDIIPKKRTDETKIKFTQLIQKSKIHAVRNFEAVMNRKDCPKGILEEAQHLVETEFQLTKFAENMFMTPKKPKDLAFTQVGVFVPGNYKLHSCPVCYRMRKNRIQVCTQCKTTVCSDGCHKTAVLNHKCLSTNEVTKAFRLSLMGGETHCLCCGISSVEQVRCRCVLTIVLHQLLFLQQNGYLYSGCLSIVGIVLEYTDISPLWSKNLFTVWPKLVDSEKDNKMVLQILQRDKKFIKESHLATCGLCNSASYCSQECLTADQKTHGPECSTIQKNVWPVLVEE